MSHRGHIATRALTTIIICYLKGIKLEVFKFVIHETPFACWDWELQKKNREFLEGINAEYFKYVEEVFSFGLTDDAKAGFVEIKATRDLIVHADGRVTETYLIKAGDQARAKEGQLVPIDHEYFTLAVRTLKTLVVEVYRGCLDAHGG